MNNKILNLNHKSDYSLTNSYEDNFEKNDWNNDNIITFDDNIIINDDYDNGYTYNKKYTFTPQKGFTFKQDKYNL